MNTRERLTKTIQTILHAHDIQVEQIYLFGSRAQGTARPDSDWDVYVLVEDDLAFAERRRLTTEIKRELARQRIPNDVLIKSNKQFQASKIYPGQIAYTVAREGIPL
ncbi:MAG: nucleotidyltransferase domain-containing protein [Anaerolineae bacterium]|nr:nucleotidyltransferase domain-containing protein [Anaerolineae bacterium]